MSSLFASLHIGQRALQIQQLALEVTQRNIANANTPYYSRQRVNLIPGDSVGWGVDAPGGGVVALSVDAFRSRFLDYRISEELQSRSENEAVLEQLSQLEVFLGAGEGGGLQAALSGFFSSLAALANDPKDLALRRDVLVKAQGLGREFRRIYEGLQSVQTSSDRAVADTVSEVNALTANIAELNARIAEAHGLHSGDEYSLRDQRQELLDRISGLVGLSYFETETGAVTLSTAGGTVLVAGDRSYAMAAATQPGASYLRVSVAGSDITDSIESGKLGGLLSVRDTIIPEYLGSLDDMAAALIERVNEQHALGSDLIGASGGAFFVPFSPAVSGSNAGAARAVSVAITDPAKIAAAGSGDGPGGNANARLLAAIQDENLLSGGMTTLSQKLAEVVHGLGARSLSATEAVETRGNVLLQLQNQRDSLTAVSLDEEAAHIILYQKAFEASARFIRVVDELTEEVINLLG